MILGLPALGCLFNFGDRVYNERLAQKDKEKFEKILSDIQDEMKKRGVSDLYRFIDFNFSTEEYATIEGLIKSALNAKNSWIRKLIACILVTAGTVETRNQKGFERCATMLDELDSLDVQLLLLLMLSANIIAKGEEAQKQANEIFEYLINDNSVYAQSINSSSLKLKSLGLIISSSSLHPYDDETLGNKKEMIEQFVHINVHEITAHLYLLIEFIMGTFKLEE